MKPGDIVLAQLPQRNDFKLRPALLLQIAPPFGDFILCGITTQIQNSVAGLDERIEPNDADFSRSGLKQTSLVRAAFLVTLAPARLSRIQGNLARFLETS